MARQLYWVDWDDPAYPKIRPIETADEGEKGLSLQQAKGEIIDHARAERMHWLRIIHRAKDATAARISRDGDQY